MNQRWLLHSDEMTKDPESAWGLLLSLFPEMGDSPLYKLNTRYLTEIENWYRSGRNYLFLESVELLDKILNAKITKVQPGNVYQLPNPINVIVPSNNLGVSGVFIAPFNPERPNSSYGNRVGGVLAYKIHGDTHLCQSDWNHYLSGDDQFTHCEDLLFTRTDYVNCSFATKLMVYLAAFPEARRAGFPSTILKPKKNGLFNTREATVNTVEFPLARKPGAAHWRRWHFRELRHEKFHKNPDGSNKIILIPDMFVNTRGIASTAVEAA